MAGAASAAASAPRTPALFDGRDLGADARPAGRRAAAAAARARPRRSARGRCVMAPAEHDRAVAFLSHVPQLVAWALADAARGDAVARRHLRLAGPASAT